MKPCRGFAILSAIFILVVLAALGAFVLNVTSSQHISSALDVQGVRAYQAARAGIEWGVYQTNATSAYNFGYASSPPDANQRSCTNANATGASSLSVFGFTVTVTCNQSTQMVSGEPFIYTLESTACSQPNAAGACPNTTDPGSLYIERRLTVSF